MPAPSEPDTARVIIVPNSAPFVEGDRKLCGLLLMLWQRLEPAIGASLVDPKLHERIMKLEAFGLQLRVHIDWSTALSYLPDFRQALTILEDQWAAIAEPLAAEFWIIEDGQVTAEIRSYAVVQPGYANFSL